MVSYMTPSQRVRVVLDTNVLVAGIRSPEGASREILHLVSEQVLTPVVSVPLFTEYESVMKREEFLEKTGLTARDVDAIWEHLLRRSKLQRINFLWRPMLSDPKDDCILECAVNGDVASLITFNKRHFPGIESFGIMLLTPSELLASGAGRKK
ncbi:MAG TPA: putative toxin-antitoxin system toxin component, PIN family [Vicinamibacteria bacterium]|nr:putative toxin-antitoxin system toxin component, PIN family [Vicinamibacteria bacterium]